MKGFPLLAVLCAAAGCAMTPEAVPPSSGEPAGVRTIRDRYAAMYRAMIAKDMAAMDELHADSFVLVHMTGARMDKRGYLDAVRDGILNYYAAEHDAVAVAVDGDRATLCGRSRVTAAVYGGGRHAWRLRQDMTLERIGGVWKFTSSQASTY